MENKLAVAREEGSEERGEIGGEKVQTSSCEVNTLGG